MPRLVDANRTCRVIEQLFCGNCNDYFRCENCSCNDVLKLLRNQPTVDVEPVRLGRNLKSEYPSLFECSVCGWSDSDTYTGDTNKYNYCPNCGSKMDEVEND